MVSFTTLKSLRDDRRGAVMILFALMVPVLVGMLGLGVEVALWYVGNRSLQTAADAAAVAAAAVEKRTGSNTSAVETVAGEEAARNGFNLGTGTIVVNQPPTTGAFASNPNAVEVLLSHPVDLLFSSMFLSTVSVNARAVSMIANMPEACVLALNSSATSAIHAHGSNTITFNGCSLASNSSDAEAIDVDGAAVLGAECASAVGGSLDSAPSLALNCGGVMENMPAITDPFASIAIPTPIPSCDHTNFTAPSGTSTISPGVYCGGFEITAGKIVDMQPGTYVIDRGLFRIAGGATLESLPGGVNIILTSSTGSNYPTVDIAGGANVDLSANASPGSPYADFAGILFYQDPNAPAGVTNAFEGGSSTNFNGALYFPSQIVSFAGGNSLTPADCTMIVADTVDFAGNAYINSNCSMLGMDPITVAGGVGLVE